MFFCGNVEPAGAGIGAGEAGRVWGDLRIAVAVRIFCDVLPGADSGAGNFGTTGTSGGNFSYRNANGAGIFSGWVSGGAGNSATVWLHGANQMADPVGVIGRVDSAAVAV